MFFFLKQFKKKFIEHKSTLFFAVLTGVLYSFPYLFFQFDLGAAFKGVQITVNPDETHYLAAVKEVIEGYTKHLSPFFYEYKDVDAPILRYSETIFGLIARLLNLSIIQFYIFSKFFFGIILFLVWYSFSYLIYKDKKIALLSSVFLCFGYELLNVFQEINVILNIFQGSAEIGNFIQLSRFTNPLLTFPIFTLGLITSFLFFKKRDYQSGLLNGLVLGINFYFYFYFWAFLLALNGVLFLNFIFTKRYKESAYLFIGLVLAVFIGTPYIFPLLKQTLLKTPSSGIDPIKRLVPTRELNISKLVIGGIILYGMYLWHKIKAKKEKILKSDKYILVLLATSIIAVNQQVITGFTVEPGHFHWYVNKPLLTIVLSVVFIYFLRSFFFNKSLRKIILFSALLFLIFFGVSFQVSAYNSNIDKYRSLQKYGVILNWLSNNTKEGAVLLSNQRLSKLIPIYTSNNVYLPISWADAYFSYPVERRLHSASIYYYLHYRGLGNYKRQFYKKKKELGFPFRIIYYKHLCGAYSCYPDRFTNSMIEHYNNFKETSFEKSLKKYKIDYVVWDKTKNPEWEVDDWPFVDKKFSHKKTSIYIVR